MNRYTIAPTLNVGLLRFSGEVSGADLIASTREFHADPRWHMGMDVIWDCRGVTSLDISPHDMREITRLRTEDIDGRDASVVSRALDVMIAHLYSQMAKHRGKQAFVCRSIGEAFSSLDLNRAMAGKLGLPPIEDDGE